MIDLKDCEHVYVCVAINCNTISLCPTNLREMKTEKKRSEEHTVYFVVIE